LSKLNSVLGALSPNVLVTTQAIEFFGIDLSTSILVTTKSLLRPGFSS
jgi:hypothetical protein|tara:strand:+ start:282 stop:425 length:144 start_codon:yes stop_codon:yes gene_type:complete